MARPKGSGGRSRYDKYRKFGRRSRIKKTRVARSKATGRFTTKANPYSKTRRTQRTTKKSRFDK